VSCAPFCVSGRAAGGGALPAKGSVERAAWPSNQPSAELANGFHVIGRLPLFVWFGERLVLSNGLFGCSPIGAADGGVDIVEL